jgi:hypothetical protein
MHWSSVIIKSHLLNLQPNYSSRGVRQQYVALTYTLSVQNKCRVTFLRKCVCVGTFSNLSNKPQQHACLQANQTHLHENSTCDMRVLAFNNCTIFEGIFMKSVLNVTSQATIAHTYTLWAPALGSKTRRLLEAVKWNNNGSVAQEILRMRNAIQTLPNLTPS